MRTGRSSETIRNSDQDLVPESQGQGQTDRESAHRSPLQVCLNK